MKISDANIKIIKDSRLKETLEASLYTDSHGLEHGSTQISATASAPSGESRGAHEAFVLEPQLAIKKFNETKLGILNREFNSQEEFDNFLISLDGTADKSNLGGNLTLVLSLAFARLKAKEEGIELFKYINQVLGSKFSAEGGSASGGQVLRSTRPFFNVINGGAHSTHPESKLNFQEFQIIPDTEDFGLALGLGQEFYRKLKDFLENKFSKENVMLGDEAGFSCAFKNNEEALEIMADLILKHKYPLKIGLDVAASQFYKDGNYLIGSKNYSAEELKNYYLQIIEAYKIFSIEDPFSEESFDDFSKLTADLYGSRRINADNIGINQSNQHQSVLIIADDLTTTNLERLQIAINKKSGNTILIKPNQIGTLTETLNVIKLAYENNWQAVVSHRSGETMDDFIADLAVGAGAFGIKAGAPSAPERMAKYNRLLEI
ncbi:MAG: hypothetical protein ABIH10_00405 [Spirochaetota bacterium]